MTSDVYCPKCGHKLLVEWEFGDAASTAGLSDAVLLARHTSYVLYANRRTCPLCGTELEISHTLVPHFVAEFAR